MPDNFSQQIKNEYSDSNARNRLKRKVEDIIRISTVPVTLQKILQVIESDSASTSELVRAIEHDQSLATRIVSMANTAFYSYSRQVSNLKMGISILGFNMVRNLAISTSLFKINTNKESLDILTNLWKHSYEVAVAASLIAERTGLVKKDDAFLAGLINDIGRVILYQLYGDVYLKISAYGRDGLLLREEEAFSADHQRVGAWFLDHYKFPKECIASVLNHHTPDKYISNYRTGSLHMIAIVYLADLIVSRDEDTFEFDLIKSTRHEDIMETIYFDEDGVFEIKEDLANMEDSINAFYAA